MILTLAADVLAQGISASTVLTVGTTVLLALLAAGSAAGGFAAFKTGRTNAIAASAVARAGEAEKTAETWRGRLEATQAEFAAYQVDTDRMTRQRDEALHVAEHEIVKLKEQVAVLTGVVTARHEILELTGIVTRMAQTQAAALAELRGDHQGQREDHAAILAAIGGRRGGDAE